MKASCAMLTDPYSRTRLFPYFCLSSSFYCTPSDVPFKLPAS
jgi:hypothetical protein